MGRKAVKRTASQEIAHQAELKRRKSERMKITRSQKDKKAAESERDRIRHQNLNASLTDSEKGERNERDKTRMQRKRNPQNQISSGGKEIDDNTAQHYLGPMDKECKHCLAKHFESEKVSNKGLSFSSCCQHGDIKFPPQLPYPE